MQQNATYLRQAYYQIHWTATDAHDIHNKVNVRLCVERIF